MDLIHLNHQSRLLGQHRLFIVLCLLNHLVEANALAVKIPLWQQHSLKLEWLTMQLLLHFVFLGMHDLAMWKYDFGEGIMAERISAKRFHPTS